MNGGGSTGVWAPGVGGCTCRGERKFVLPKRNRCLMYVGALIWKTLPIDLRTVCCVSFQHFPLVRMMRKLLVWELEKCKFVNTSPDNGLYSELFMSCHQSFPVKMGRL